MTRALNLSSYVFVFSLYVFLFAPVLVLIFFSFNNASSLAVWSGFSTRWYHELANDVSILEALTNSIEIAFCATLLSAALGLCVGLSPRLIFKKLPLVP